MSVVVDASVAVKWFLPEADSGAARDLLLQPDALIAPDILPIEIGNVFWKAHRLGKIDETQAEVALAAIRGALVLHPAAAMVEGALRLSFTLDHPIYDCLYLLLAEQQDAQLITADQRLARRLRDTKFSHRVRWLSDRASDAGK
ncbi:MAG: type II toxin-antitoxin system VapC family toxin [Candidatus Eiseniibacteriota bacterium]